MNTGSRIKFGSFNSHADRVTFNAIKRSERAAKRARAVRLAKRDRDYAESGCASPVTVEVRGNRVVETRGQVCIASRCNFTPHN